MYNLHVREKGVMVCACRWKCCDSIMGGRGLMVDGSGDGVRVYAQLGESCVMVPVLYM